MSKYGRRTRLLVLTSTFPRWPGDACPAFVADLSQGLAQRFDVTVLAPGAPGAAPHERMGELDVRRYTYSLPRASQHLAEGAILPNLRAHPLLFAQVPGLVAAQLFAAWRLVRSGSFDAIHAHWAVPQGWVAALLRSWTGVPVLTTTHGGDVYALRTGAALRAKRYALRNSDRITAVSAHLKGEVVGLGIDESRVDVLPMGVDTSRFTPDAASPALRESLNPAGPLLLFVGRLVEKKGARYAIEAMSLIVASRPRARLIIIGDGPERQRLEQLARDMCLQDNVTFAGAIANDKLPAYYASADLLIGPSVVEANGDTESFGVVFAEAMASGCPVICTDAGGIADLTAGGEYARVVPQRDAAAIADAACDLIRNPGQLARLRGRGIERMRDRFDHSLIHQAYGDIIERVAA
ncbi:MAG: glycosyltransferase [Dehalococcoidia bacterium]